MSSVPLSAPQTLAPSIARKHCNSPRDPYRRPQTHIRIQLIEHKISHVGARKAQSPQAPP